MNKNVRFGAQPFGWRTSIILLATAVVILGCVLFVLPQIEAGSSGAGGQENYGNNINKEISATQDATALGLVEQTLAQTSSGEITLSFAGEKWRIIGARGEDGEDLGAGIVPPPEAGGLTLLSEGKIAEPELDAREKEYILLRRSSETGAAKKFWTLAAEESWVFEQDESFFAKKENLACWFTLKDSLAILPAKGAGAKPFVQSSEPAEVGGGISGEARLTLTTRELALSSAGANVERVSDVAIANVLYIGATPKKRLEAMLVRNGELKYWWLLSTSTNEWGQALFALPEDYEESTDRVYLFVGESGETEGCADFASKPVRIL